MKAKHLLISLILLLAALVPGAALKAEDVNLSDYVKVISNPVKSYVRETIGGGLQYSQRNLSTLYRGDLVGDKWQEQTVSAITFDDATAVKVVSWQKTGVSTWGASTLREAILDFEDKNPGYKVVAGVNGDFSDVTAPATHQPANNFVSMGDVLKKDNSANSWKGVLGFGDGKEYVFGHPQATDHIYLKIYEDGYDNDFIREELEVASINNVNETGISLLYPNGGQNFAVSGYKVYQGTYINYKVSNNVYPTDNPILGSFIKGEINEVKTDLTNIDQVPEGTFYLLAKDGSLDGKIDAGTKVKCEYNLLDSFAGVQNTIGYNFKILTNSVPQYKGVYAPNTPFVSSNHPRTMVGLKADGSPVFLVVDGRGPQGSMRTGITLFEGGELLRVYDCVEGFNLDGGGSSTMIIRDEDDHLVVVNTPSDGNERGVANSLLFVIRDPHIEITSVTDSSITVEQTAPVVKGTISNIEVKLDGTALPMDNGKVVFGNLDKGTDYNFSYTYDLEVNGKFLKGLSRKYVIQTETKMTPFISTFKTSSVNDNTVTFKYGIEDEDGRILRAFILFGSTRFTVDPDQTSATITDLPYGEELSFQLIAEYDNGDKQLKSEALPITLTAPKKGCLSGSAVYGELSIMTIAASVIFIRRRRSF